MSVTREWLSKKGFSLPFSICLHAEKQEALMTLQIFVMNLNSFMKFGKISIIFSCLNIIDKRKVLNFIISDTNNFLISSIIFKSVVISTDAMNNHCLSSFIMHPKKRLLCMSTQEYKNLFYVRVRALQCEWIQMRL